MKQNRSMEGFHWQQSKPETEDSPRDQSYAIGPSPSLLESSAVTLATEASPVSSSRPAEDPSGPIAGAKVCRSGPSSARRDQSEISETVDTLAGEPETILDEADDNFDTRMKSLGFKRSPSQPNTVGDGACGIRALCDQLSLCCDDPMFGPEEHVLARCSTAIQAKYMVKRQELDTGFFEPNVADWCTRMSKNNEFIDNIFLLIFSQVQERDIVVIPVHKGSAAGSDGNGDFRWIKGMKLQKISDQFRPS